MQNRYNFIDCKLIKLLLSTALFDTWNCYSAVSKEVQYITYTPTEG